MRVLVGCEESGAVRDAFLARGHDAWSCDLVETRSPRKSNHLTGDIHRALRGMHWDLFICFPPCTYLSNSGAKHLYEGMKRWNDDGTENPRNRDRWYEMVQAALFFNNMLNAKVDRIVIENPIQHGHARALIRRYDQIIHPWQHGHGEQKATCLWLKNVPPLMPTRVVDGREQRVWKMAPGENRRRDRSETFPGIADAMAQQWAPFIR